MYRKHITLLAACSLAALFASSSALAHDCDTPSASHHRHTRVAAPKVHHVKRVVKVSTRAHATLAREPIDVTVYGGTPRPPVKHGCSSAQAEGQPECVCPEQPQSTAALLSTGEWERLR